MARAPIGKHGRDHRPPGTLGPDDPGGHDPIPIVIPTGGSSIDIETADPASPTAGQSYLNTATQKYCIFDGTKWWRTSMTADAFDSYSNTVMGAAPNSYWKLTEASGNFADSMPNNYTGIPTGTITYHVATGLTDAPPYGIKLPGAVTTYVDFGNHYDYGTGSFTMEALIFISALPSGNSTILCNGANGSNGWQWRINSAGKMQMTANWAGSTLFTSTTALTTGVWHHIAVSRDAPGPIWTYKCYFDGVLDPVGTGTAVLTATAEDLYLGVNKVGTSFIEPLSASTTLAGVAIWDGTQLSDATIAAHAHAAGF